MIKKRRLQKIIPQVVVAVVLLGLFLGFMALRHPSPLKAPRLTQSSAISNSLYYASNRAYSVKIGERNTNKPTIEYSLPTGNKVSFTYSDLKGQTTSPAVKDDTITFKNVSPNVDLKYTTLPNGLKEEVILNKQVSGNIFKFSLNATNAFPRAQTDSLFSSTFFDKNGQYLFHFEKPFAVDANGSRTDNVTYQIKKERNNSYTLTLDVDREWLQSPDRSYPVSIDPTVVHDITSEFAAGQLDRVKDVGTLPTSAPSALATGGTITYSGGYVIHTFTSSGTFTPSQDLTLEILAVAGGGGGGGSDGAGGGGGGGGVVNSTGVNVSAQGYTVTIGGGGAGSAPHGGSGARGENSSFSNLVVATGGGGGGGYDDTLTTAPRTGGSGGGGGSSMDGSFNGASGTSGQGYAGGNGLSTGSITSQSGAGGGGAGSVGGNSSTSVSGNGGNGVSSNISGSAVIYAGGGAGSKRSTGSVGTPGQGGGGTAVVGGAGGNGTDGLGGGGAGGSDGNSGGNGGSGIVIIRYYSGVEDTYANLESYYQELPADQYTVALWHLNEASGNPVDSSINSNNGTNYNTTVITGPLSNARNFNGTNAYLQSGSLAGLKTGNVVHSIEAWVKPNALPTTRQWPLILGTAANNNVHWLWNSTGIFNVGIFNVGSCNLYPRIGEWNHIAYTYDGTVMNCYLDGVYVGRVASTALSLTNTVLTIGQVQLTEAYFNGSFDEIRVSNTVRSAEEIRLDASRRPYSTFTSDVLDLTYAKSWNSLKWNANRLATGDGETATPSATANLVAQWNFNETSGTSAVSGGTCGATCNGTLYNMTTTGQDAGLKTGWTAAGKRWGTGALMFDGSNDYVEITDNNNLDLTTAATLEIWAYKYSHKSYQMYISKGPTTSYQLMDYGTTGKISFRWGTDSDVLWSNNVVPINTWTHIVGVYDGSYLYIYINGRISAKKAYTTNAIANTNALRIGARSDGYYFLGILDGAKIYNRALTENEIYSNYNRGRIEFQTRVGGTTTPNDGTWEAWKPSTSETQIANFDSYLYPTTSTGLVSYWPMDEDSGTTVYDETGSNDAISTGATIGNYGVFDNNRKFNGSSYLTVSDNASLDFTGNFTIMGWIKRETSTNGTFVSKTVNGPTGGYGVLWGINGEIYCRTADGTSYVDSYTPTNQLVVGTWVHVAAVRNGTSCRVYVNGTDVTSSTGTHTTVSANNVDLIIGARSDLGTEYLNGQLDEVKIYNTALSASEINQDALQGSTNPDSLQESTDSIIKQEGTASTKLQINTAIPDYSTVGLWHLEETGGTGAYIKDSSGNGNHGTPTSTTTDGVLGKAGVFDNTDDFIEIPDHSSLDLTSNGTIEAWIKPSANDANNWFLCKNGNYCLGVNATGALLFTGASAQDNAGTSLLAGTWHHVAITNNNTTVTYYIDGATSGTDTVGWGTTLTNTLRIGRDGSTNYFSGVIDEVRISNVVRTATEIANSYRLGRSQRISSFISSTDLSSTSKIPFYIASDRLGTYSKVTISESAYANYEPDTSTIALWRLDELNGSGSYVKDISGNTNHGTPTGTKISQGYVDTARYFNGTSDYVKAATSTSLNSPTSMSVSAWINTVDTGANRPIVGKSTGCATTGYLMWLNQNSVGTGLVSFWSPTGGWVNSTIAVNDGKWHHVVATNDNSTTKIYIDGVLNNTGAGSGSRSSTTELQIGGSTTGAGCTGMWYTGLIDEVRIDNVVRTAEEIRQAYEIGARTYNITVDFKARLDNGNLISNSGDTSFTIDETSYGSSAMASHLFSGDKIIIKENYDGTEYLAQGTVSSVNSATGAVTVSSWDSSSTFPTGGFSFSATVFKWQHEYFDLTQSLPGHLDAITRVTYSITDNILGANIWIDDLRSSTGYLNTPSGSTITSSLGNRYFQYRAILSQNDLSASSSAITSVSLNYTSNMFPNIPTLDNPADTDMNLDLNLSSNFKTTSTDIDNDYLRYKIELCTDLSMTTNCQTFDQTVSQTGWSGQNTQTNTAYTSGTQATYTLQSALNPNTVYYWRSYAIDPDGRNTWSSTQATPYSFTTTFQPDPPTNLLTNNVTNNPTVDTSNSVYFSALYIDSDSDNGIHYQIEVNTNNTFTGTVMWDSTKTAFGAPVVSGDQTGDITYAGSALATNTTYYWRIKIWDVNGAVSPLSSVGQFTMNTKPTTPTLDSPSNSGTGVPTTAVLKTTATDPDSNYLRYKIELCTNLAMTTNCQTFDQTVSTTGWSGQNTQTNTAYTSGTQATYTLQSALNPNTVYYWRSYAIDPAGINEWSSTQGTPYSFTTSQPPNIPTFGPPTDAATNQILSPVITTTATDSDGDTIRYKIELCTDLSMTTNCQTFDQTVSTTGWSASSYASGATGSYTIQTALSTNTTYYWRTYAIDQAGSNTWSGTQSPPRSFTTSNLPNTPSLDQPTNTQTDVIAVTIFKTTTTDTDGDYLRYKITICDDVNMGIGCQTFSQTTSQTGWSGKDAQGGTAYSSGTQATYTMQSALTAGKTYYWKSYAIDPAGSNSWSTAQSTPYSFTIKNSSAAPAPCNISKAPNNGSITVNWTDTNDEEAYQVWKVTDGGLPAQLGTNLAANTIQVVDSAVSINHSYGYLVRGLRTDGGTTLYSPWCSTTTTYLSSGALYMEGINFD